MQMKNGVNTIINLHPSIFYDRNGGTNASINKPCPVWRGGQEPWCGFYRWGWEERVSAEFGFREIHLWVLSHEPADTQEPPQQDEVTLSFLLLNYVSSCFLLKNFIIILSQRKSDNSVQMTNFYSFIIYLYNNILYILFQTNGLIKLVSFHFHPFGYNVTFTYSTPIWPVRELFKSLKNQKDRLKGNSVLFALLKLHLTDSFNELKEEADVKGDVSLLVWPAED